MKRALGPVLLSSLLAACASTSKFGTGGPSLEDLADEMSKRDVVFFGEEHGNAVGHLQQLQFLRLLHDRRPDLILSMEMLERDQQQAVDSYLEGDITEQEFIDQAKLGDSYLDRYRPLVNFCKDNGYPVIAANLPAELRKQLRDGGYDAIKDSPFAPRQVSAPDGPYREAFLKAMEGHAGFDEQTLDTFYRAQCAWDDTMAEAIVDRWRAALEPKPLIVHVVGKFHVENRLGTAAKVLDREPGLDIGVITMEAASTLLAKGAGEYVMVVPAQPTFKKAKAAAAPAEDDAGPAPIRAAEGANPGRPALGFMPDYEAGVTGVLVGSLRPDGPAEAAGLQEGDVLIEVDGLPVDDVRMYVDALSSLTVGSTVEVVVVRGGEQKKMQIKVGERVN